MIFPEIMSEIILLNRSLLLCVWDIFSLIGKGKRHSTITTSMDIYTHISDVKKEQALDRLGKEYQSRGRVKRKGQA